MEPEKKEDKKGCIQSDMDDSLALSNILDEMGFSETDRTAMIGATCIRETLMQIGFSLHSVLHCVLTVGSYAEGTTHFGMNPDEDLLMFIPAMYVYKNKQKRTYCHMDAHLIMLKDLNTPPGYTKLQIVNNGKIFRPKHSLQNAQPHEYIYEKLVKDFAGRCVLSNTFLKMTDFIIDERNSPAETILGKTKGTKTAMDTDYVKAYKCDFIPDVAKPWFRRLHSNLASTTCIDKLSKLGCFVVPVGCPTSIEKGMEWRISFSLQEKYIMLNLNQTQYKTYIMLKLIKKYIIEPNVGKCISSYHCKTALFHTIEGYCVSRWRDDNLKGCVIECLKLINTWIDNEFCPNYFVPEENMFVGKLNDNNKRSLKVVFKKLINENNSFRDMMALVIEKICYVSNTFNLVVNVHSEIERVCNKFTKNFSILTVFGYPNQRNAFSNLFALTLDSSHMKVVVFRLFIDALDYINRVDSYLKCENATGKYMPIPMAMRYIFFSKQCPPIIDGNYWSNIALLAKPFYNTNYEKELIFEALSLASGHIHNLLASVCLANILSNESTKVRAKLIENYDKGKKVNYFANRLKQLSLYYNEKQYKYCYKILKDLFLRQKFTTFKCVCSTTGHIHVNKTRVNKIIFQSNRSIETIISIVKENMCCCVLFDVYELEAAISPMFYEAFRSCFTPVDSRLDTYDYWFDRVVVDPVTYLNFMQMKCAFKLGKICVVAKALSDIERTIVSHIPDTDLAHLETALNILGHCYLNKGWSRIALQCYKVSWAIRPLHNAAKWHVMFLIFGNNYC